MDDIISNPVVWAVFGVVVFLGGRFFVASYFPEDHWLNESLDGPGGDTGGCDGGGD